MVNNVYDLVTRTMEKKFPRRVAFRWVEDATGTVREKTYAQYARDIRRAAAWFARNIPDIEGKRVALLSKNCYEYGVNTFGAVMAGAVLVTVNQKKTWDELSWELGLADPALILNDGWIMAAVPSWRPPMGSACGPWMSGRIPTRVNWNGRSTPMP